MGYTRLLTIVVTVFNERATILEAIRQVENLDVEKEIIVVDNFSTDGTREILKKYGNDTLKIVFQKRNYGYGQSIITGCDMAMGRYIYIHNSDLEYDPCYVYEMINLAKAEDADAVFGSRLANRKASYFQIIKERPYYLASVIATFMINKFYGRNFTDIIGSKFYKTSALRDLYPISHRDITFDFEVVSKLCKRGFKVMEIPVSYKPRSAKEGKKIKAINSFAALAAMLKVKMFD